MLERKRTITVIRTQLIPICHWEDATLLQEFLSEALTVKCENLLGCHFCQRSDRVCACDYRPNKIVSMYLGHQGQPWLSFLFTSLSWVWNSASRSSWQARNLPQSGNDKHTSPWWLFPSCEDQTQVFMLVGSNSITWIISASDFRVFFKGIRQVNLLNIKY